MSDITDVGGRAAYAPPVATRGLAWPLGLRLRAADWLAAAAGLLLALRLLLIVTAQPMMGYADNLDFFRDSVCTGLWRAHDGAPLFSGHRDGPVERLDRTGVVFPEGCLTSSDHAFGWTVARLHPVGGHASLREVGTLKVLAVLAAVAFLFTRRMRSRTRALLAGALLLGLGDSAIGLYFNTLYADASLIAAAAVALGFACLLADRQARDVAGWPVVLGAAVALVWLGLSKSQGAALAPVLGLPLAALLAALPPGHAGGRAPAALLLAVSLAAPLAFWAGNAGPPDSHAARIQRVNIWDTVAGAVLPAATDPAAALATLGLPPACAAAIGLDWYSPGREAAEQACPALDSLSRARLAPLFLADPATFLCPMARAIARSRPAQLRLTPFADPEDAARPRFALLRATSLSTWLTILPGWAYALLLWAAVAAGATAPWALAATALRRPAAIGPALMAAGLGAAVIALTLASAVFGDGLTELNRHCAGVLVGVSFLLAAALSAATERRRS